MYKIYCLVDPRNSRIFYVGQTIQSLKTRLYQHTKATCNTRLRKYIARIIKAGSFPEIKLLEDNIPCRKIYEREVFWIDKYNCNGNKTYNVVLVGILSRKIVFPKKAAKRREIALK